MSVVNEKTINNFTMSSAVPVIPPPENLIRDEKQLYLFLSACQEKYRGNGNSQKIVSFSQRIQPVDFLAVLQEINQPNQLHFYWENPRLQEAIFGYGVTKSLTINSPDRFSQSQQFVEHCQAHTIRVGESIGNEPYWFCSFSFFASETERDIPFPAATIFLPQIQLIKKREQYTLVVNCSLNQKINLKILLEQIFNYINSISLKNYQILDIERQFNSVNNCSISPSYNFTDAVRSALKSIDKHEFSKLVLAHAIDVVSPVSFQVISALNQLRKRHPDCYVFSISNGKGAQFIGASPERLISIQNKQLVTDALAGSAPRGKNQREDHYLAQKLLRSEKERREHQAVSNFIQERLLNLGLTPHCSPIKLLGLSNIQHLWTPIYANVKSNIHPLQIVSNLHPTPAVAGVPAEIACQEIRRYETFSRCLYAAPIGWLDSQGNSEFIVGIRSALIQGNQARLYAGAGIVAGSDPDKELAEIQLKFQALMKALF